MRIFLLIFIGFVARGWADGGAILSRQKVENLDITIFASPAPLRAGPVDVSVLVQETGKTAPVMDAAVEVIWNASPDAPVEWLPPCCSMGALDRMPALRGHSQNKTLYSAIVPVKSAGPSQFSVRVKRGDTVAAITCDVDVQPPRSPVFAYWPFLAFPPFFVAGFALHQRLSRKKRLCA